MAFENGLSALQSLNEVKRGMYWEFAKRAWPGPTGNIASTKKRSAYRRAAGQLLARMHKAGLVQHFTYREYGVLEGGYRLTRSGRIQAAALK